MTPDELKGTVPVVESDSDAEVVFWEVRISDDYNSRAGFSSVLDHYIRLKIYTTRGRDEYNKVDIEYGNLGDLGFDVKDIVARTVRADGTIFELKPADIFEKENVKGKGLKFKSKSFVMPGVEVGSIIEYRWKEVRSNMFSYYVKLELAREIPVQNVKYYIRPLANYPLGMRLHSINVAAGFVKEKDNYYSTTMSRVPSFKKEAYMPGVDRVRPWVLVYYGDDDEKLSAAEYWRLIGKETFNNHKSLFSANDSVKREAIKIVGDAAGTEEKVKRIYDFCRTAIVDIDDDASGITTDNLKKIKANKTAADVLSRRTGKWHDIQMLFGAMLTALGIDTRVANVSSRDEPNFDRGLGNSYFNRAEIIAVKIGESWQFASPSSKYLPFGFLPAAHEGAVALISDPDQPFFVDTPVSRPEASKQIRTADLTLNVDGSIEGDVRIEYTGHLGATVKEANDELPPLAREKALIESIKSKTLDTAEVTRVSVENSNDPNKPVVYVFHLRIPNYGDSTAKRLFVRPDIFERSSSEVFGNSTRKHNIHFDHAWSEIDEIMIQFPNGLSVENLESPSDIMDTTANISLESKYEHIKGSKTLKYSRKFILGNRSVLEIDSSKYNEIKKLFDSIHHSMMDGILFLKSQ